jgi:hypothetical protein
MSVTSGGDSIRPYGTLGRFLPTGPSDESLGYGHPVPMGPRKSPISPFVPMGLLDVFCQPAPAMNRWAMAIRSRWDPEIPDQSIRPYGTPGRFLPTSPSDESLGYCHPVPTGPGEQWVDAQIIGPDHQCLMQSLQLVIILLSWIAVGFLNREELV